MAELGNSVIRGSLRVINGIHGDLEGSATKIKATAGTDKYYLVGTLGQSATNANSVAYENTAVYSDNGTLHATAFSGSLDAANLTGTLSVLRIVDGSIPWAKLANNTASGKQVTYYGNTLTINGNLNVTGTTTFTASNSLSISDAMIELSSRSSYSTALTKVTGMYARAMDGASASGFIGLAPSSVFKSKTGYGNYATRNAAVFLPSATFDSGTNDITYAIDDLKEILTDLNVLPAISSSAVTADSDSDGNYLVRKDKTGTLYVGPISWHGSSKVGMLYANPASSTAPNAAGANPYINFFEGQTFKSAVRLLGSGAASVASDSAGNVTISATDYHVQVTTDDSGTIYLSGPASIPTTNTANVGTTLKGSTGVYVTAKKLYSNYGVASTGDLSLESGSSNSILLKSNLKSDSNPTTYVENSTGYIYELGHRPFPATSFSAAPTANHYYLPMRGNGTAGLVKSVSYVSSADLPAAASQDNDTLYLVDFGTLDPLSSGTLATTADKMYWKMSNTGESVISDVSLSGNVLTFTKRTKTDGTTNVTTSSPKFTVDLSGVLPHHLMTGSAALSTIADTSITSYAFSSMPSDFPPVPNHSTIYTERNVGTPYQLLVGDCNYYIWKKPISGSSWTKMYSGYADHAAYVDNSLTFTGYSTGSYNGSSAVSVNIPTDDSQLANSAGYLTENTGIKIFRGSSISTANPYYWAAMVNSSQGGSPVLPSSGWWHVLSMDWVGNDTTNWISQLALPTQDQSDAHLYFRKNSDSNVSIDSASWIQVANKADVGVTKITAADSTLTLSPNPIVSEGTIGINLGNENTWTGKQTFHGPGIHQLAVPGYAGGTESNGNTGLEVVSDGSNAGMSAAYVDLSKTNNDFWGRFIYWFDTHKLEIDHLSSDSTGYAATLPDKSGTLALTSDIPTKLSSFTNDINGTEQSWTAKQSYSAPVYLYGTGSSGAISVAAPLNIFPVGTHDGFKEGIRLHSAANNWCDITLCGADNTADSGTTANSWFIGNNNGNFFMTRNGADDENPAAQLSCAGNVWYAKGAEFISKCLINIAAYPSVGSNHPVLTLNNPGAWDAGIGSNGVGSETQFGAVTNASTDTAWASTQIHSWNFLGLLKHNSFPVPCIYHIAGSNGTARWYFFGTLTSSDDSSDSMIRILSGNGYNGVASQNSIIDIMIKDGYQSTRTYTNSCGITVYRRAATGFTMKVIATSETVYKIYFYLPWGWSDGEVDLYGNYSAFSFSGTWLSSEPTPGSSEATQDILFFDHAFTSVENSWSAVQTFGSQMVSTVATGTAPFSITSTTGVTNLNSDYVDGYHASNLWRSDGATWNPGADVSLTAWGNSQEWSFDIHRAGYTGCYWQVWEESHSTLLAVYPDDGHIAAPYGITTKSLTSTVATGTAPLTVASTTLVTNLNSDLLDGFHVQEQNSLGKAWGVVPTVKSDGVMEVGSYVDFHNSSADGIDFAVRLQTNGQSTGIAVTLPSVSGTIMVKEDASSYPEIIDLTTVS